MAITKVVSEIPGTVWKIEAAPGQKVSEDDPIILIESMKMEIPVGAPMDGVVKEILVEQGEAVAEGQEIAILEH